MMIPIKMKTILTLSLWILLMVSMTMKTPSILCLTLSTYSVIAGLTMSIKLNLSLTPFILVLTISGGLMVLFLYFTASSPNTQTKHSPNEKQMMMATMILMAPLMMSPKIQQSSQLKEVMDPVINVFSKSSSPMTSMMIMMLGIMLIVVVSICSKCSHPIRKVKKN